MGIVRDWVDARLVRRALARDPDAFAELVRRHMPPVSAVAMAYTKNYADAEDVAQEAFLKAWLSLDTLRECHRFGGWIVTIARNVARANLSKNREQAKHLERFRLETAMPTPARDTGEMTAMQELLPALIADLSEHDRELVLLRYQAGKKTREIAALLSMSHSAVRKQLERVRHALGQALLESMEPDATEKTRRDRRSKQIASAVFAVCPSWTDAAPAGASVLGIATLIKAAALAVVVGAAGVTAFMTYQPAGLGAEPAKTVRALAPQAPAQTQETSSAAHGTRSSVPEPEPATTATAAQGTASISGRLVEEDTGNGVAMATIQLGCPSAKSESDAQTDAEGKYVFEGLSPGEYWISLHWDEDFVRRYPRSRYKDQEKKLSVQAGSVVSDVNFSVVRGLAVRGKVIGPSGNALAGALINAWSDPNEVETDARTDEKGQFEITGFGTDLPAYFWPHYEGLAAAPHGPIKIPADGVDRLVLTMAPESTIAGRLVDQEGTPLSDASIVPWPRGVFTSSQSVTTDAAGAFELRGLHESRYRFNVTLSGNSSSQRLEDNQSIDVATGEHLSGVELVCVVPGTLTISGRVTDDAGAPQRGIRVWTSRMNANSSTDTDADGNYELRDLGAGEYEVNAQGVSWSGPAWYTEIAEAGAENVDFVVPRMAKLRGQVLDAATETPIADFEVLVPGPAMRWTTFHDEDGRFEFHSLRPDEMRLAARAKGYTMGFSEQFVLSSGQTQENVVVKLARAGTVSGVVRTPDGQPARDAAVGLDLGRIGGSARTNAKGEFVIADAPPGTWPLEAWHPDYAPAKVPVTVVADEEMRAEITLTRGATLGGTVSMGEESVADVRIELIQQIDENTIGYRQECTTDVQGRYAFRGIPTGELVLHLNPMLGGFGRVIDVPIQFSGEENKKYDVRLRDGTASAVFEVKLGPALAGAEGNAYVELTYVSEGGQIEKIYSSIGHLPEPRLNGLPSGPATLTAKYTSSTLNTVLSEMEPREVFIREGVENRFDLEFAEPDAE
ncbi:MAG: sigma-70 family RNA polymerase sigma factor [Candidatus Hydrogenedentes bacterium]|nr:sigma-70 family RNA polymerase sigma factor [Candidatus Hydrogenedentota bacterium]